MNITIIPNTFSDRYSDLEDFGKKINELSQPLADEESQETVLISGDDEKVGEGTSAEGTVLKEKLSSTPVVVSKLVRTSASFSPYSSRREKKPTTSRTSESRADIGKYSRSRSPRMKSVTADHVGRGW
jgi:hypothetical protein